MKHLYYAAQVAELAPAESPRPGTSEWANAQPFGTRLRRREWDVPGHRNNPGACHWFRDPAAGGLLRTVGADGKVVPGNLGPKIELLGLDGWYVPTQPAIAAASASSETTFEVGDLVRCVDASVPANMQGGHLYLVGATGKLADGRPGVCVTGKPFGHPLPVFDWEGGPTSKLHWRTSRFVLVARVGTGAWAAALLEAGVPVRVTVWRDQQRYPCGHLALAGDWVLYRWRDRTGTERANRWTSLEDLRTWIWSEHPDRRFELYPGERPPESAPAPSPAPGSFAWAKALAESGRYIRRLPWSSPHGIHYRFIDSELRCYHGEARCDRPGQHDHGSLSAEDRSHEQAATDWEEYVPAPVAPAASPKYCERGHTLYFHPGSGERCRRIRSDGDPVPEDIALAVASGRLVAVRFVPGKK